MNQAENYCRVIKKLCNKAMLPPEYQQVEYLQSSGYQYIATGVYNADGLDVTFQSTSRGSHGVAGYYLSNNTTNNRLSVAELQEYRVFMASSDGNYFSVAVDSYKHRVYFGAYTNWAVYWDDVYKKTIAKQTTSTNYEAFLFRSQAMPNSNGLKIYFCSIYIGTTKARDYIPCYRKSDNKPGMYDLVTNTFYTNAGTGEFTVGNNI